MFFIGTFIPWFRIQSEGTRWTWFSHLFSFFSLYQFLGLCLSPWHFLKGTSQIGLVWCFLRNRLKFCISVKTKQAAAVILCPPLCLVSGGTWSPFILLLVQLHFRLNIWDEIAWHYAKVTWKVGAPWGKGEGMEGVHLSWNSHQFARAANPDGLNTEIYFLTVLEARRAQDQSAVRVGLSWGLCPWFADGRSLHVSSHGSPCWSVSLSLIKAPIILD